MWNDLVLILTVAFWDRLGEEFTKDLVLMEKDGKRFFCPKQYLEMGQ